MGEFIDAIVPLWMSRISEPILVGVTVIAVLVYVWKAVVNSRAFTYFEDRDHRRVERMRELKELEQDASGGTFKQERELLEQDLRVRYSRDQFRRYFMIKFHDEELNASENKGQKNPYRMRGTTNMMFFIMMWALFVPGTLLLIMALAASISEGSGRPEKPSWVVLHSFLPAYGMGLGMLVSVGLLSTFISWVWRRNLCNYAFNRYVRPSLDQGVRSILGEDPRQPGDPKYPEAMEEFRAEMVRLGDKQTTFSMITGSLMGAIIPISLVYVALQQLNRTVAAKTILLLGLFLLVIGFIMSLVTFYRNSKIPPSPPIRPSKAPRRGAHARSFMEFRKRMGRGPGLVDEHADEVAAYARADGGQEADDQRVRVRRGPRP